MKDDCISRTAAIDMVKRCFQPEHRNREVALQMCVDGLSGLPSVQPEPCEDCINRDAALEQFADYVTSGYADSVEDFEAYSDIIKALPSVQPERKTGHWINVNEGKWNTIPAYKCSECGADADLRDWSGESPFCPWCGAKMEGEAG